MTTRELEGANFGEIHDQDTERLLEELPMHRAELEAQNEELRRAQVKLEKVRIDHEEFYHLAPIGYITLDSSLKIVDSNHAKILPAHAARRCRVTA